jgi:hypothetical protein
MGSTNTPWYTHANGSYLFLVTIVQVCVDYVQLYSARSLSALPCFHYSLHSCCDHLIPCRRKLDR